MGEHWQIFLFFCGVLSAWGVIIIATTRWTLTRGLAANDLRMAQVEKSISDGKAENQKREREILQLRCDLPLEYVRREDAIRQETVINAKLDTLAAKIDYLRVERHVEKRNDGE